jgi:hypothetical protein
MSVAIIRLLTVRVRGVSLFETLAFACLVALMLTVYLFKAGAGQEGARINELNRAIRAEQRDVRRLQEELGRLEQPARIEQLSDRMLGLQPVRAKQELQVADLQAIARHPAVPPVSPAPPAAAPVAASVVGVH